MRNALIVAVVAALLGAPLAMGQATRPALEQLDAEMRSLYADVAAGTVRVQLPMPTVARLIGPDRDWITKWRHHIDPRVLKQLAEPASRSIDVHAPAAGERERLAGAPGSSSKTVQYLDDVADRMTAVLPRDAGAGECVGVVLDGGGHVIIPTYVPRDEAGDRPLRVTAGEEQTDATFVGSDRQTNVTVVKLAKPFGKPLSFADEKPARGSLVVLLGPSRRPAKLSLWTGGHEDHTVVVDIDGRIAGFAQPGQLLGGQDLRFVAGEIIKHGKVKRAELGVWIAQVQPDDPVRQQAPLLGARPALRIAKVMADSAAVTAGLKVGDLIVSLAGAPVDDLPTFAAAISTHSGPTELKIIRDGKETAVTVNLEAR